MNKTISTRAGLITGLCILLFTLFLQRLGVPPQSPLVLLQFLFVLLGVVISCFLLYRFYAGIRFVEAFTHCAKTVATTLMIVLLGNALLFFILSPKGTPFSQLTFMIMKTVFSYALSGLLSSFFTSYIFHTFTKK